MVIAANFGKQSHPAWHHNLRALPIAMVTIDGKAALYEATELIGDERDRQFQEAVVLNPGWLRYRTRAGERGLPVLRLVPRPRLQDVAPLPATPR